MFPAFHADLLDDASALICRIGSVDIQQFSTALQILPSGEMRGDAMIFSQISYCGATCCLRAGDTVDRQASRCRLDEVQQHLDDGRFSCAIGSEKSKIFACLDRKRDIVDCSKRTILFGHGIQCNHKQSIFVLIRHVNIIKAVQWKFRGNSGDRILNYLSPFPKTVCEAGLFPFLFLLNTVNGICLARCFNKCMRFRMIDNNRSPADIRFRRTER